MSFQDHQGRCFAYRELMKAAASDIATGERKGATVIHAEADASLELKKKQTRRRGVVAIFGRKRA